MDIEKQYIEAVGTDVERRKCPRYIATWELETAVVHVREFFFGIGDEGHKVLILVAFEPGAPRPAAIMLVDSSEKCVFDVDVHPAYEKRGLEFSLWLMATDRLGRLAQGPQHGC